jgi:hypothetical protein
LRWLLDTYRNAFGAQRLFAKNWDYVYEHFEGRDKRVFSLSKVCGKTRPRAQYAALNERFDE